MTKYKIPMHKLLYFRLKTSNSKNSVKRIFIKNLSYRKSEPF